MNKYEEMIHEVARQIWEIDATSRVTMTVSNEFYEAIKDKLKGDTFLSDFGAVTILRKETT